VNSKFDRRSFFKKVGLSGVGGAVASFLFNSNAGEAAGLDSTFPTRAPLSEIKSLDKLLGSFSPGQVIAINSFHNDIAQILVEEITYSYLSHGIRVIHGSMGMNLFASDWVDRCAELHKWRKKIENNSSDTGNHRLKSFARRLLYSSPIEFLWIESGCLDELEKDIKEDIHSRLHTHFQVVFLTGANCPPTDFSRHRIDYIRLKEIAKKNQTLIFTIGSFTGDIPLKHRDVILKEVDYLITSPKFCLKDNKLDWPSSMTRVPIEVLSSKELQPRRQIQLYMNMESGDLDDIPDISDKDEYIADLVISAQRIPMAVYVQLHKNKTLYVKLKGRRDKGVELIQNAQSRDISIVEDSSLAWEIFNEFEIYDPLPHCLYEDLAKVYLQAFKQDFDTQKFNPK
jgi:type III secretion system FlhB-like substrate exporter